MSKRFPLPAGPGSIGETFEQLSQVLPPEDIQNLREQIDATYKDLENSANDFLGPNLTVAAELRDRCKLLLDRYNEFPPELQRLAIAAIYYFVDPADAVSDETPLVGLEDDVLVVNHVLERLGLESLYIID